jgi:hypothetical protein
VGLAQELVLDHVIVADIERGVARAAFETSLVDNDFLNSDFFLRVN